MKLSRLVAQPDWGRFGPFSPAFGRAFAYERMQRLKVRWSVHLIVLLCQLGIGMHINHRGLDEGMAKLVLDGQKMRPAMQQVRCQGMTQ